MGDFTWHTSDPDHGLVNMNPLPGLPHPFDKPVYLLAPDGRKWREDNYEGYGVFGGVESGAELARWNFPEAETAGKDEYDLHRSSVEQSLYPYGGGRLGQGVVRFPLKFTRNPDATYEELPASIPAAGDVKYLRLSDFDIHFEDGTVISGHGSVATAEPDTPDYTDPNWISQQIEGSGYVLDSLGEFWVARGKELGLLDDAAEDDDLFDWCSEIFGDNPEQLTLPDGARMVYTAYEESVHEQLYGLMFDSRIRSAGDLPINITRLYDALSRERLAELADIFDEAAPEGADRYDLMSLLQVVRYERGLPLDAEVLYPQAAEFENAIYFAEHDPSVITDDLVADYARNLAAFEQNIQRGRTFFMPKKRLNPFRLNQ